MDNNISLQVKRLIEIDRKAVELAQERESEFHDLEEKHRADIDRVSGLLQLAKEEARKSFEDQVQKAQREAEAASAQTDKKLMEIEKSMSQAVLKLSEEVWERLLQDLK